MPNFIVPPGGFAGFSQMTPASRAALFPPGSARGRAVGKRRRKRKGASAGGRKRTRSRKTKGRKLKFGSPAWRKKYMRK